MHNLRVGYSCISVTKALHLPVQHIPKRRALGPHTEALSYPRLRVLCSAKSA